MNDQTVPSSVPTVGDWSAALEAAFLARLEADMSGEQCRRLQQLLVELERSTAPLVNNEPDAATVRFAVLAVAAVRALAPELGEGAAPLGRCSSPSAIRSGPVPGPCSTHPPTR